MANSGFRIGTGRIVLVALCAVAMLVTAALPSGASTNAQLSELPTAVTTGAAASGAALSVAVSSVAWKPCRDGFQCATVRVPLDYDQPKGQKISLSVIRLPAASASQRIGSLLVNPGGPGGSGVDVVRAIGKSLPLEIRGRFDLVGFDPRGIARSTPLRCYDTFDQAVADRAPFAFPVTSAEVSVQRSADRKLASACARHGGAILNHMSTADVARDMDFLRQALGDRKLTYLGFSYGSMLGQTYANMYPDKVRAVVIDGVLDPIAWTTGRGNQARTLPFTTRLNSDVGAQKTLDEFFRLCDQAGSDCAFSGDSRARFAALAAQLRLNPLVIVDPGSGETFRFTYADLIGFSLGSLYGASSWPDFAYFLADVEREATPTTLGQRLAAVRSALGVQSAQAATPAQEQYPNEIEGGPGVFCSDSVNPSKFAAWPSAAANAERKHGYFGRIWTWVSSVCQPWTPTAGQDRYLGPWTARTANPVLVVGNYFDPATAYEGAVAASRLLPNSRLLSYAGWGHTATFTGNFCVDSTVIKYLVTTKTPPAGTVCQPEGSPFGPLEAASTRVAAVPLPAIVGATLPEPVRRAMGN